MRVNADEHGTTVSYDVLMDAGSGESTLTAADVEMDVEHAREKNKESAPVRGGSGGRGGANEKERPGMGGGLESSAGSKGCKSGGVGGSGREMPGAEEDSREGRSFPGKESSDGNSSGGEEGNLDKVRRGSNANPRCLAQPLILSGCSRRF